MAHATLLPMAGYEVELSKIIAGGDDPFHGGPGFQDHGATFAASLAADSEIATGADESDATAFANATSQPLATRFAVDASQSSGSIAAQFAAEPRGAVVTRGAQSGHTRAGRPHACGPGAAGHGVSRRLAGGTHPDKPSAAGSDSDE